VLVDNSWQWGSPGSFGLPGQQLKYAIDVINYDTGCASSNFTVSVSAPSGFSVSIPTSAISLKSSSSGYVWAYVTSPSAAADGDYPLIITVQRSGTSNTTASSTTYYKVYSTDTVAPTLYWPNPDNGTIISGRSYTFGVNARDDHAVKSIDLYIDNTHITTTSCDDIAFDCQLYYTSSPPSPGQHTATFKARDWMGNVGVLMASFTVS
jgi:hypothetical protein